MLYTKTLSAGLNFTGPLGTVNEIPSPSGLPAQKILRVIPGVSFNYTFQYLNNLSPQASSPINLVGWIGTWTITWTGGRTIYTTSVTPGHSGVFFSGNQASMISLVMTAADTLTIPWQVATYTFSITDPLNNVYQLLTGGIGVIGSPTQWWQNP